MKITRELLRKWSAYCGDEKIAALVPPEGLDWRGIVALDIPERDRLWVLLREELIPARELRLLACDLADEALSLIPAEEVDQRSRDAILVSRRFADGLASQDELAAASSAAWAAASAAAWADAWVDVRADAHKKHLAETVALLTRLEKET